MALIDHPEKYIVMLFQKEQAEGRTKQCIVHENGHSYPAITLNSDELIYGVYKKKYYFSPSALFVQDNNQITKIPWEDVTSCTTSHGDGSKISIVTMCDGSKIEVHISDLATGWQGRISQLFHKMIKKWGSEISFGHAPIPIKKCLTDKCWLAEFVPNVYPRPNDSTILKTLETIYSHNSIELTYAEVREYDEGTPISDSLVVFGTISEAELSEIANIIGTNEVTPASQNIVNFIGGEVQGKTIWEVSWR